MNKEWVEQKNKEYADKINHIMTYIEPAIENNPMLNSERKEKILNHLRNKDYSLADVYVSYAYLFVEDNQKGYDVFKKWCMEISSELTRLKSYKHNKDMFSLYLDSDPMEFDGDIIITDPCYIIKHRDDSTRPKWEDYMQLQDYQGLTRKELEAVEYFEDYEKFQEAKNKWDEEHPDDWDVCYYGDEMEQLGINHYMTRDTLYGDWSCTTFNTDTKEKIGSFCADAGLVSVFLLDEVLKYNPAFDHHLNRPWTTTLIKDFKGTVQFIVKEENYIYDDEECTGYAVEVVGHGINKVTGEPINFVGCQTGL